MIFNTRFAPSPTGPLHLGHAYSVLLAHDTARRNSGAFFLRMDDIDQSRVRDHWRDQIIEDLTWLGITWEGEIWSQAARTRRYTDALQTLWDLGLLYPCTCSRADIKAAANAPQEGVPMIGPDGLVYPGICREVPIGAFEARAVLRLNMRKALQHIDFNSIIFSEGESAYERNAEEMIEGIGDVVLARKDMAASYHLAIVVDDAEQDISHVIRGEDLRDATFIHILLHKLLGYATPTYHHHRLIRDENGKRLAKRDDARAISKYRADGFSPNDIRRLVGLEITP